MSMGKGMGKDKMDVRKKESGRFPAISDHASRKEWEAACWEKVLESKDLLRLLVTAHERHDLVLRATALDSISAGKSYKQIGEELWLSPQTISSIKKTINEKSYRSYLERSKKERKKRAYSYPKPGRPRPEGIPRRTKYGILYM